MNVLRSILETLLHSTNVHFVTIGNLSSKEKNNSTTCRTENAAKLNLRAGDSHFLQKQLNNNIQ